MGDCDDSYDFTNLMPFIKKLRNGYDLVMGNRYLGGISKGAMPLSHKIGVKGLTWLGNIIYKTKLGDYHCGLRGFPKEKINELNLESPGMELASEIVIKSVIKNYKMIEIPIILKHNHIKRKPHIHRHTLRIYSTPLSTCI